MVGYGPYNATLERVIDGDTFVALADCGFSVFARVHVRLEGVDTPELYGPEHDRARRAKAYVHDLLSGSAFILHSKRWDRSFARWVCGVETPAGEDLGELLVGSGLAERV